MEAVERYLSDLEPTDDSPFGGKIMLFGGDWKQLLPVVEETHGSEILEYTLKKCDFWPDFRVSPRFEN